MTSGEVAENSGSGGAPAKLRNVAVIGAGITGLSAAHRLISLDDNVQVSVFEAAASPGGIIRTEKTDDGFLMELGPDSFITNKPAGVQLCEELGFTDQLIPTDERFRRSLVLRKGKPLPVPDGFMLMAPARPWAIATTPILSVAGKLRLLSEAFVRSKADTDDESLACFVRRRFGRQALDRLVQPLVGGIYTSDPEKLSLQATLPRFPEMERQHGSVIRATLANERHKRSAEAESSGSGARYGLFAAPAEGLSSLIDRLVSRLAATGRCELKTSSPVRMVQQCNRQWDVQLASETRTFDALIVTLPTHKAADLFPNDEFQPLTDSLKTIEYASSAIVVSGHQLSDFSYPLDAFGLVIPAIEKKNTLAISFSSRKFPGRAPEGQVLLRTFVGGAMQPELLEHDDQRIQQLVEQDLKDILGMSRLPLFSQVMRYSQAMPQYHVGHADRISAIETQVASYPGLQLAGSAYHGVGIPDSIASGRKAADAVLTEFDSVSVTA